MTTIDIDIDIDIMSATCPRCDHSVINASPGQRIECWWCRHIYAHEEQRDLNELRRVHTLRTTTGTIVDQKLVRKVLDDQRKAIDALRGQPQLDDGAGDE